jgi:hypothetical protein
LKLTFRRFESTQYIGNGSRHTAASDTTFLHPRVETDCADDGLYERSSGALALSVLGMANAKIAPVQL